MKIRLDGAVTVERTDDNCFRVGAVRAGVSSEDAGFYFAEVDALQLVARVVELLLGDPGRVGP